MSSTELIARAKSGDREAWDALAVAAMPRLRGVIRRFVGDPDDTDDLVQDTLLRGYEKIHTFRGASTFSTWLISIGTRTALNHLRTRKRWRWDAQVRIAKHLHGTPKGRAGLQTILQSPQHRFDAREHIAFCFPIPSPRLMDETLRPVASCAASTLPRPCRVCRSFTP